MFSYYLPPDPSKSKGRPPDGGSPNRSRALLIIALFAGAIIYYGAFRSQVQNAVVVKEITLDELYSAIGKGEVKELNVDVANRMATGSFKDGKKFKTGFADSSALEKKALESGIKVTAIVERPSIFLSLLIDLLPWVMIMFFVWFMFLRPMASSKGGPLGGFITGGKKTVGDWEVRTNVMFDDVAGCEEPKDEVKQVVDFLKNPEDFFHLGARLPRGVLLVGSTGVGKTLLAKAVAGEADVPFGYISGSGFVEMFVGVGASRMRQLFREAKERAPCILFIDEIDGFGRKRGSGLGGGHDEREQCLNEALAAMDGFESGDGIIVMAATNRPDVLDPALLRPGRFDRQIEVPLPDINGREAILKVHARKIKAAPNIDLRAIAKTTPMFSGAQLAKVVNEAAVIATVRKAKEVEQRDLFEAFEREAYGLKRKGRVISKRELETIAYHEAGHTVTAKFTPGTDPVRKVTVIGQGESGGSTHFLPEEDRHLQTKSYLMAQLTAGMGGRAAEMFKFEDESSGARGDFAYATAIAKAMVTEYGMSEEVGKRVFVQRSGFLGFVSETPDCSPETQRLIDEEMKRILDDAYEAASAVIAAHPAELEAIAKALLEKETLTGEEVDAILASVKPAKEDVREDLPPSI